MTLAPNMSAGVIELVSGFHVLIAASCAHCGRSVEPTGSADDCLVLECPCADDGRSVAVMITGVEVGLVVDEEPQERKRPALVGLDGGLAKRKDPTR